MNETKQNPFAKASENKVLNNTPQETEAISTKEIDINSFSDTALKDKVKYTRPDLNGTKDKINKFQIFPANLKEKYQTKSKEAEYVTNTMILTYDSVNADGVNNREYISGARQFIQEDGSLSEIKFYYEGSETQSAYLWVKVAEAIGIKPEELSPRQFVAFLSSKPAVDVVGVEYENYGQPKGAPKFMTKNMPGKLYKA